MKILCTYCSASKDPDKGLIPAFKRYISPRIIYVQELAEKEDVHFCILSGQFGLVDWNHPLPWYDHLLIREEVQDLVKKVVNQIIDKKIDEIHYYTRSPKFDMNLIPYLNSIEIACEQSSIDLQVFTMEEPRLSATIRNWKLIMEMAAEARQLMIVNREEGEIKFEELLSKYPDDGMIFFQKASAFEALGGYDQAKKNYEIAKTLFPLDRWQWEAQEAINQMEKHLFKGILSDAKNRVQNIDNINPKIKERVLSAIELTEKQPKITGIGLRETLEIIVTGLLIKHQLEIFNLDRNIEVIKIKEIAPSIIINHMHTVRIIGNRAAHSESLEPPLKPTDIYPSIYSLLAILEWVNTHLKK